MAVGVSLSKAELKGFRSRFAAAVRSQAGGGIVGAGAPGTG